MPSLEALGWNSFFEEQVQESREFAPARVSEEHKQMYRVLSESGEMLAEVSGKLRHQAKGRDGFPAVGDWVLVTPDPIGQSATIHRILNRRSKFSRKVAGVKTEEQVLAANIDTVFLLQSLNRDFNPRRLERYLTVAWESGVNPVVLLTKLDLCDDVRPFLVQVEEIAPAIPVHGLSALTGQGIEQLDCYLAMGQTVALLGSSGVGKSTLVNRLAGRDIMKVREIRDDDDRGRHTTSARQIILLPRGGILIDTPGLRELQLWGEGSGLDRSFGDIDELSRQCRFRDCRHDSEPGCAVRQALAARRLDGSRMESYLKLRAELNYLERKRDIRAQLAEKKRWKRIHRDFNRRMRARESQ